MICTLLFTFAAGSPVVSIHCHLLPVQMYTNRHVFIHINVLTFVVIYISNSMFTTCKAITWIEKALLRNNALNTSRVSVSSMFSATCCHSNTPLLFSMHVPSGQLVLRLTEIRDDPQSFANKSVRLKGM